ncbi:MAG: protein kinase [Phycisphaerales bacterium]|nr:protein kinase [Phycisphaerales bacterium]
MTAEAPASLPEPIGPYVFERELGRGGMGVVWLARDQRLDRQVAVKELGPDLSTDPVRLARFRREARTLAQLNHPNVATIYGLEEAGDRVLIVMEFAPGPTLADVIKSGVLNAEPTPERALSLARQIIAGMAAAHEQGIIHRDLKPLNVKVRPDGVVKILDFGLAKAAAPAGPGSIEASQMPTAAVDATAAGMIMGSAGYMSPEQARGQPVDPRTDVWAFGAVLFEMLAGVMCFGGETFSDALAALLTKDPDLAALHRATPPAITDLVRRCLQRPLPQRPADMRAVRTDFERALTGGASTGPTALPTMPAIDPGVVGASAAIAKSVTRFAASRVGDDRPQGPPPSSALVPNNLPGAMASFVGREREMSEVVALLTMAPDDRTGAGSRLVTLTGPGGTGKTRLAVEAAREAALPPASGPVPFPEGIWLADLAPLPPTAGPDAAPAVAARLAQALGVKEEAGKDLLDAVVARLAQSAGSRDARALIILDNCEHLLDGASAVISDLLRRAPQVRVLATSREGLGVSGEITYRVHPLATPDAVSGPADPAALMQFGAVRLFAERAAAAAPGFSISVSNAAAVAGICRRLDGIPLAIELAAARVKALAVTELAKRLDDAFRILTGGARGALPRQQTLRATIDWSYSLLEEPEKMLLRRLGVFAGFFPLEAVERVAPGPGLEDFELLDALTHLVDKSLVVFEESRSPDGGGRYRLLETVRQFAREKLDAEGREQADELRLRHLRYYAQAMDEWEPKLRGEEQADAFRWMDAQFDNFRVALAFGAESPSDEAGLLSVGLAGALGRYFDTRGLLSEGAAILDRAIARAGKLPDQAAARASLIKVLNRAGNLAWARGDYAASRAHYERGVPLTRDAGDQRALAGLLSNLATVLVEQNELDEAHRLYSEVLEMSRSMNFAWGVAASLDNLGIVERMRGRLDESRALHMQAMDMRRNISDPGVLAVSRLNLAAVDLEAGRFPEARAYLREALITVQDMGDRRLMAEALERLAVACAGEGKGEAAGRLVGAVEALRESLGVARQASERWVAEKARTLALGAMDEPAFEEARRQGKASGLAVALRLAADITGAGGAGAVTGPASLPRSPLATV